MVQQNYFQICIQQNFRSGKSFFPCVKTVIIFGDHYYLEIRNANKLNFFYKYIENIFDILAKRFIF